MPVEECWHFLESANAYGSLRRIDEQHPIAFYAWLGTAGERGLVLISEVEPAGLPTFKAVEVTTVPVQGTKWMTTISLRNKDLSGLFAVLCDDVVEAGRRQDAGSVHRFFSMRLGHWRRLFELQGGDMSLSEQRGLVAELVILRDASRIWPIASCVYAWQGPHLADQDFNFGKVVIEAKCIVASAATVTISSVEQLGDADSVALLLGVVGLATANPGSEGTFSLTGLISEIQEMLTDQADASVEFQRRTLLAGYSANEAYEVLKYRVDSIRYYRVTNGFPRLTRNSLPSGISNARYDIAIAALGPYGGQLKA